MRLNSAVMSLLAWGLGMVPLGALAQPQVGATELARAKTLLEISRAVLTAEQFALLSGKLAAAESAVVELTSVARASQAVATAAESGAASASARIVTTGGRVLMGAADLLPLLILLLWPATAHAHGLEKEKPEVRAARLKAEEAIKELSLAAREVESERKAASPGISRMVTPVTTTPATASSMGSNSKMAKIYKREHETKRDALGTNKNLSKFDLCGCKDGRVVVKAHGCKGPIISSTDFVWK